MKKTRRSSDRRVVQWFAPGRGKRRDVYCGGGRRRRSVEKMEKKKPLACREEDEVQFVSDLGFF